jgi:hypothetical protein
MREAEPRDISREEKENMMKSLVLMMTIALPPAVLRAGPQQCPHVEATLNGAYVSVVTGTAGSPVWGPFKGPVATMGKYLFDGQGNLQVPTVTIVAANPPLNVTPPFVITGSYAINRDCTGNLTLNFAPNPDGHYNLVVSPDGRQVTLISADSGDVLTGTATRLARDGDRD